ncbi:MAG: hypothetical protein ABSC08_15940, partial [Bryobacteraceae bacterium]
LKSRVIITAYNQHGGSYPEPWSGSAITNLLAWSRPRHKITQSNLAGLGTSGRCLDNITHRLAPAPILGNDRCG